MTPICEFSIDGLPKTINAISQAHWAIRYKEAVRWKRLVINACVINQIFGLKLKKATLELIRHSSKEIDFDNLAGSFKHVIDGLTEAHVILDDNPQVIGAPTFIWKKCKPKEGKITIRIFAPDSDDIDE